jgi:hypothetical protein
MADKATAQQIVAGNQPIVVLLVKLVEATGGPDFVPRYEMFERLIGGCVWECLFQPWVREHFPEPYTCRKP